MDNPIGFENSRLCTSSKLSIDIILTSMTMEAKTRLYAKLLGGYLSGSFNFSLMCTIRRPCSIEYLSRPESELLYL